MGYLGKNIYRALFSLIALSVPGDIESAGWNRAEYARAQKYLSGKIDFNKKDIVLDFGCGTGLQAKWIVPKVQSIVGIDQSFLIVRRARENTGNYPNTEIVLCKSEALPFGSNTFSKIFCCGVFRYFPDFDYAKNILKEMFRVTKSGGRIFIFDLPDVEKRKFRKNLKRELRHPVRCLMNILSYYCICYYSAEEILNFCRSCGMPVHFIRDDGVFHVDEEGFSCWIEVLK